MFSEPPLRVSKNFRSPPPPQHLHPPPPLAILNELSLMHTTLAVISIEVMSSNPVQAWFHFFLFRFQLISLLLKLCITAIINHVFISAVQIDELSYAPQKCKKVGRTRQCRLALWVVRICRFFLINKAIQQQGTRKDEYACLCCFFPPRWNTLSLIKQP